MSEGFNVHFPAMVGETMYLLTQGGEICEGVVEGYTVDGCSPYKICVRLSVEGKTMYRRLASVGRTIFPNRQSAEVAVREDGGESVKIYLDKNGREIELSPEEKENLHIVEEIPRYAARKNNRVYAYTFRECMRRTAEIPDGCIAVWEYERETCGWNAGANYYGVCVARDPRHDESDGGKV